MKKPSIGKVILSFFTLIVLGSFLFSLLYIPREEWEFMKSVEKAFNQTDSNFVKISEVTDFKWDTVCYFPTYNPFPRFAYLLPNSSSKKEAFEQYYKYDYEVIKSDMPYYWSPFFHGAFIFIQDKEVTEKLIYDTRGLRSLNGKMKDMYSDFNIKGESFYFLSEVGILNDGCIDNKNAAFIKHYYKENTPGYILITNLTKE